MTRLRQFQKDLEHLWATMQVRPNHICIDGIHFTATMSRAEFNEGVKILRERGLLKRRRRKNGV